MKVAFAGGDWAVFTDKNVAGQFVARSDGRLQFQDHWTVGPRDYSDPRFQWPPHSKALFEAAAGQFNW